MRRNVVLLAAGLALAACGGDSEAGPTGEREYVDALAADYRSVERFGATTTEEASRCLATAVVQGIGVAELDRAGVSPLDLRSATDLQSLPLTAPDGMAADLQAAIVSCGMVAPMEQTFLAGLAEELPAPLSPESSTCVTGAIDDNGFSLTIAAMLMDASNERAVVNALMSGMAGCPGAISEMLIASLAAGGELTPENRACIEAFVMSDPVAAAAPFLALGAGSEEYGMRMGQACLGPA